MFSKPITMITLVALAMKGKSIQRLAWVAAIVFGGMTSHSLAVQYDFLSVSGNNLPGNAAYSQFDSDYTTDFIGVTHSFSADPAGVGAADNQNNLIFPSQFTTLFPGTGLVQGHLAQTVYGHSSVVTFDLTTYTIRPLQDLVFGMWNPTDETPQVQPGPAQYRIQLWDGSNLGNPTFNLIGNQDNQTQVQGRRQLVMLPNGDVIPGGPINGGVGIHMDAAFWTINVPAGTTEIRVYGNLDPLNLIGDGVGYYFAEIVPEPSSFALVAIGLITMGALQNRRSR
jgi:hypothetical protein